MLHKTIRYTDDYYAPLVQKEQHLLDSIKHIGFTANKTPVISENKLLDSWKGSLEDMELNRFGQPIDTRLKTSWNSKLEEVPIQELLEVNLINQISPYLLIQGLYESFKASHYSDKFIINVSSAEGQFRDRNKSKFHPHTNMTKAALNMMTLTSAKSLANDGIYMNCVDVGWVSTGAIEPLRKKQFDVGYIPPLDAVDSAARILHPIKEHLENNIIHIRKLLKDYTIDEW
ncbi:MAG: NAD(P)-dependent dehydrogenase (short-subunit alcohol dehydrogenase family) [Maribacter sp.]|jgi:NAD(P)-dependent dehydrogenase (short-subunit alcohol dehydrogenase family)